jgi:hypothetical protein
MELVPWHVMWIWRIMSRIMVMRAAHPEVYVLVDVLMRTLLIVALLRVGSFMA